MIGVHKVNLSLLVSVFFKSKKKTFLINMALVLFQISCIFAAYIAG